MKADRCLKTAAALVTGPRAQSHGKDLRQSLTTTAELWTAYLGVVISAEQAAMMMALLKIGRSSTGAKKSDHYIDAAAYTAIAGQLRDN